jgi:biopolymer transport protein ExbB
LPDPAAFVAGIALALNTTILGLAIAIPALAAHAYILRRVELLAARISVGVECLIHGDTESSAAAREFHTAPLK